MFEFLREWSESAWEVEYLGSNKNFRAEGAEWEVGIKKTAPKAPKMEGYEKLRRRRGGQEKNWFSKYILQPYPSGIFSPFPYRKMYIFLPYASVLSNFRWSRIGSLSWHPVLVWWRTDLTPYHHYPISSTNHFTTLIDAVILSRLKCC